jgi:hypothetical protein
MKYNRYQCKFLILGERLADRSDPTTQLEPMIAAMAAIVSVAIASIIYGSPYRSSLGEYP